MRVEPFKGKNFLMGCYFNRKDPRVWVHCDEKYKAAGVTLNFAKAASWVWMAVLIGALVACLFGMKWLCRDCFTSYDQIARETICLVLGLFAVWCPLVVVTCFWMAARDLKRHPGPQGPR